MKRFRKFKATSPHLLLVGLSLAALASVVVLLWWDIARQPLVPDGFSYSANSLTSRVFYDQASGQAGSPQYLRTNLELALKYAKGQPAIKSTLGTTTVYGQANLTRDNQLVDPLRGVYIGGSVSSSEFVLAPRGLVRGDSYTFRHPAYSSVAQMKYAGEETIGGLRVYHYKALFAEGTTYFGGVTDPDKPILQSLELRQEPQLQVWVEPTSGWMVKYHAEISSRLIDRVSGVDRGIYGKITETTSEESVMQHIAYATTQKLRFAFIGQIIPSIILAILLALFLIGFIATVKARTVPVYAATGTVLAISSAIIAGWFASIEPLKMFFAGPTGVNPLTAICFILVALAIIALYRNKREASALAGCIVGAFALLQIFGELGVVTFSVDTLLFRDAISEDGAVGARMSVYTAATFLLLAVGLVKASATSSKSKIHFARFLVGMVLTFGALGLLVVLTRLDKLLTINFTEPFSAIPSLLFVVCSFTLLQLFRTLNERPDNIFSTIKAVKWPLFAALPLVVISIWTQLERNSVASERSGLFSSQIVTFEKSLGAQMAKYEATLDGARALFGASAEVTASEFGSYVRDYLSKQQTGLDEVGFALSDKGSSREQIAYLEMARAGGSQYVGYDLSSDTILKEAMDYARDTGRAIMSKQTTSLQTAEETNSRVFIFRPIYKNNSDITTIEKRRQALVGHVFVTVDMNRLFSSISPNTLDMVSVLVYDGVGTRTESLLYSKGDLAKSLSDLQETRTIFTTNRPWTILYIAQPGYGNDSLKQMLPTLIFIGGSVIYFAILSIIYLIVRQRAR